MPWLRGTTRKSYTMLPSKPFVVSLVLSVTFGSYLSKSFGKVTTGCLMSLRFPLPPTTTRNVTGVPALTLLLRSCEDIEKRPTPPEKSAGFCGSGSTCISIAGATMFRFTSIYPEPPLKNASNGSTLRFCITTTPLNVRLGIVILPVICGYITYWLHVTQR